MFRISIIVAVLGLVSPSFGQDWLQPFHSRLKSDDAKVPPFTDQVFGADQTRLVDNFTREHRDALTAQHLADWNVPGDLERIMGFSDSSGVVVRGQSPGEGAGGGAGAAAATDPSVPLTQLQLQNVFTPETYNASGYSNTFIVQPVIPLNIGEEAFFPYHIIRPTLPIVAPTADPDGPLGVQGGLGDLTVVDAFIHPCEELKTNFGIGYVGILPTRTHPQLGRGEWQLGPSAVVISRAIPKWIVGGLVEVPFSLGSDAYTVQMQAIALRLLPDEWFVGWGDQILRFDDENGGYDIPLSLQLGKVAKVGNTPMKLFVEPIYTPDGLRSGPGGAQWSIKLNLTILMPDAKLYDPLLSGR